MKVTLWSLFFTTVVMALSTHNARSQVTIGGLTEPRAGTILDLNNTTKGGLLLPNIDIPDLSKIPSVGFTGIDAEQDENENLAGMVVYNINATTGPGVFIWDGYDWIRLNTSGSLILTEDKFNTNPFPYDGSNQNKYIASDHSCNQAGSFSFTWVSGEEYIDHLTILDAGGGIFIVKFQPNDRASSRHAIMLITDACGNSNTFVFKQEGDTTGCGTTPSVPDIKAENSFTLCVDGAAYLYLEGYPATDTYTWTLNGNEIGRGPQYVATKPGKYIVYGDKIGCSNSKEVQIVASNASAPEAVRLVANTNNGVVCTPGGTVELIVTAPSTGNIVWYKNGVKQDHSNYNGKTTINADAGMWQAVVENGNCSSVASERAYVYEDNSGISIPTPQIKINGQTSNWSLCQSGSAYLEVANANQQYTYTWYVNNTQIGIGNGVYYPVPSEAGSLVIRVRATGAGCATESNANVTVTAGSAPIPVVVGNPTLCGGITTLSVNTSVSSPVVTWYKDGAVISGATGLSLIVIEPGNYSATVADNGCVSSMSAVRPVVLSDFTRLSWIKEPQNANFGDMRTLEASGTNGPLTYTWTIMRDDPGKTDITSTVIKAGQGTQQILVEFPPTSGPGATEQIIIRVRGNNACGQDITDPVLEKTISLSDVCPAPKITNPVSPQTVDVVVNNSVVLSVSAANLNQPSYKWYKGSTEIQGANTASFVYNPNQIGTETFWCRVSNGCGTHADSPIFTVNASKNPDNMEQGSGSLTGKVCFDIAESNFGGACGSSDARLSNKTNFAAMSNQDKTYTFKASSVGDNFHFVVIDSEQVLDETTPYIVTNNFPGASFVSGNTATIQLNFKTSLNSTNANPLIVGRSSAQAAKVQLYAVWKTGSTDYSILMTIKIQDCICCGAMISPTEWKAFMCHNLGADQSLSPFTPAKGLNGSYYKYGGGDWGLKNGHLWSPVADVNTGNTKPWCFDSPKMNPTDNWSDNVKKADDPCPAGYRVPTKAQWQGVLDNNDITSTGVSTWNNSVTNFSAGVFVGSALFLPASGYYSGNGGNLLNRGFEGRYWSTTFSRNTYGSTPIENTMDWIFYMTFQRTSKSIAESYKDNAFPVRCIAE